MTRPDAREKTTRRDRYLSIHLESEPAIIQGRPYEMVLEHPIFKVDGSPGAHRICKDADKVDDCSLEAIFGLQAAKTPYLFRGKKAASPS